MRTRLSRVVCDLCFTVDSQCCRSLLQEQAQAQELATCRTELAQTQTELARLRSELQQRGQELATREREVAQKEVQLSQLQGRVTGLQGEQRRLAASLQVTAASVARPRLWLTAGPAANLVNELQVDQRRLPASFHVTYMPHLCCTMDFANHWWVFWGNWQPQHHFLALAWHDS